MSLSCATAGAQPSRVAVDLGVSEATVYRWIAQDEVDAGERPGVRTGESLELSRARSRIRELEAELELGIRASGRPGEEGESARPAGFPASDWSPERASSRPIRRNPVSRRLLDDDAEGTADMRLSGSLPPKPSGSEASRRRLNRARASATAGLGRFRPRRWRLGSLLPIRTVPLLEKRRRRLISSEA